MEARYELQFEGVINKEKSYTIALKVTLHILFKKKQCKFLLSKSLWSNLSGHVKSKISIVEEKLS